MHRTRWLVVLGSTLGLTASEGPLINFTFGVFLKPISQAFGVGRGVASMSLTIGILITALTLPAAGRLVDRYGARNPTIVATLLVALLLALTAWFASSITSFALLFALLGVAGASITPLPYMKAISSTFDHKRGLAFALALTGVGIGTVLVPIFAQHLVTAYGWRVGYLGVAALAVVVPVPALLLFIPSDGGSHADREGSRMPKGLTAKEALRGRHLYLLGTGLFLGAGAVNGTIAHVVPLLTDRGVPAAQAVSAIALVGISSIIGRIVCGYLLDRFWAPAVALISIAGAILGLTLLAWHPSVFTARIAVVLLGLGLGVEADLVGFLVSRYLGLKAFGALFGFVFGAFIVATATAPVLMGYLFDLTGSYVVCLIIFICCAAASAVLLLALGPYAYPAEHVAPDSQAAHLV